MSARYRLVRLVANPYAGTTFPMAALLDQGGVVTLVQGHLPGRECLGSVRAARLGQLVMRELRVEPRFDHLPQSVGPQAVLDEVREVPRHAPDPERWIAETLLGGRPQHGQLEPAPPRGMKRATQGLRFFQNYGVGQYIRKRYVPPVDDPLHAAGELGTVSHYVVGDLDGQHTRMLMEPVSLTQKNWREDVSDIGKIFGAYRHLLTKTGIEDTTLWAYLLAGGSRSDRDEATSRLEQFAHRIADTTIASSRGPMLQRIRDLGQSTEPGALL